MHKQAAAINTFFFLSHGATIMERSVKLYGDTAELQFKNHSSAMPTVCASNLGTNYLSIYVWLLFVSCAFNLGSVIVATEHVKSYIGSSRPR